VTLLGKSEHRILYVDGSRLGRNLDVWVGPFGLHIYWFDVWKSRLDWCANWRKPVE
jgi:hypothetical protein